MIQFETWPDVPCLRGLSEFSTHLDSFSARQVEEWGLLLCACVHYVDLLNAGYKARMR